MSENKIHQLMLNFLYSVFYLEIFKAVDAMFEHHLPGQSIEL